jgi:LysM repeat protein
MLLTDPNGPMSLQPRRAGLGRISRASQFAAPAILFLSFAALGANISRAQEQQTSQSQQDQSVAEAARQERARKQEKQKTAKHVYTEEDLKHPNILTPEDRAQIEAKRTECAQKDNCSPAQNPPAPLDANSPAPGTSLGPETSLGEVARQLRKQKELQALKPKQTEPFHLPSETPVLASPVLPALPAIQPSAQPARPKISSPKLYSPRIPSPKISSPKAPANIFRRDPFSGMPARPELRQPEVARPEIRQPEKRSTEVHPAVRETVRPKTNSDVHPKLPTNVHPKVSAGVAPKISSGVPSETGKDFLLVAPPTKVRPDFSKAIHPTFRAYDRPVTPAQPRISTRLAAPNIAVQPAQPAAPVVESSRPVAPVSTIRPVAPPVVAAPAQPVVTQHTVSVRRGDSLWKLAQQNLGRGSRWPELVAVNPSIVDPNQIRAGVRVNLPNPAVSPVLTLGSKTNADARIKVRKGDTLWTLAKAKLGRSTAWTCLAAANLSISDPNRIYENQELLVPVSCQP